jgi:hypothetical protein
MAVRGTVTKVGAGDRPYEAVFADGRYGGLFESLRKAQEQIELVAGSGKLLKWTTVALGPTGIECFEGSDP